jgi:hypothetical protein
MRRRVVAIVAVFAVAASTVVVAIASTTAAGLPAYTNGYQKWPKLKRIQVKGPNPHVKVKAVYVNKKKAGKAWPVGTVIVKDIVSPGDSFVSQVAVMRKAKRTSASGGWVFVEFSRANAEARYALLAQGATCTGCHSLAKRNDWVFRAP